MRKIQLRFLAPLLIGASLTRFLVAAQPTTPSESLKLFLPRLDAALASRDSQQIAYIADVQSWLTARYPALTSLSMMNLPPGPLVREEVSSQGSDSILQSVLYIDGAQHEWRVSLRFNTESHEWLATIRPHACPSGGVVGPPKVGQRQIAIPITTWTILECNKLPQ
jgi:hypothetical protein